MLKATLEGINCIKVVPRKYLFFLKIFILFYLNWTQLFRDKCYSRNQEHMEINEGARNIPFILTKERVREGWY